MPARGDVLSQLKKVLDAPLFQRAEKQTRFLQYVVERTLDGDTGALKEAQIGSAVYGRPADYDPKADPIVRVEASRLRARLREYYEEGGAGDEIRFQLAKGGYSVQFLTAQGEVTPSPVAAEPPPSVPPPTRRRIWPIAAALAALVLVPGLWWVWHTRQEPAPRTMDSVGILPFADLSQAHDQGFLCDGLSEQITDELTRVAGLRVAGRSSVARFRGSALEPQQIAAELGVAALLEGSVRRNGDQVRVTVQLTDAANGYQVWSDTFDGHATDFFALEDDISRNVARRLAVNLAESAETKAARYAPRRLEAHRLFVRARELHRTMEVANFPEALRLHEQAVATDPSYALAHSGLAHVLITVEGRIPGDIQEMHRRALAEAKRSLELDPRLADGHSAMIRYYRDIDKDYASAEAACRTALREFPHVASILGSCGGVFELMGRQQEAVAAHEGAVATNPLWADGLHALSAAYYRVGRFDDALRAAARVRRLAPDYLSVFTTIALCYAAKGQPDKALDTVQEAEALGAAEPAVWIGLRGYLAGRGGHAADARRALDELAVLRKGGRVSHLFDGWIYVGLNDLPAAAKQIGLADEQGDGEVLFGIRDWILKPLWDNPTTRRAMERAARGD